MGDQDAKMNTDTDKTDLLIEYLLSNLAEEEMLRIEEQFFVDDIAYESLECAEYELIDRYVQGELSKEQQEKFERLFLSVPGRRKKLEVAIALSKYGSTDEEMETRERTDNKGNPFLLSQLFSNTYLRLAAFVVIGLGVGFGTWYSFFYNSGISKGMAALDSAYRDGRPVESRISGLSYAPWSATRAGGLPDGEPTHRELAERLLLEAVADHPDAASHHALGQLYLAERQFDKAIAQFNAALQSAPSNPGLQSDLGAALFEKGKANRSGDDSNKNAELFAESLQHLNEALKLDSSRLDALYNRALLHQEMRLPEQAKEDWQKYLEQDSTSQWTEEARRNLRRIEEQSGKVSQSKEEILGAFLKAYEARDDRAMWEVIGQNKDVISEKDVSSQLLNSYFNSLANNQEGEAARTLQTLAYVGELETQKAGDPYLSGLAEFYRQSPRSKLQMIAQARELIRVGHDNYFQENMTQAVEAYRKAGTIFGDTGDRWEALTADYWTGYALLEDSKTLQSLPYLSQLTQICERENYKWLLARTLLSLSSAQFNLNEYSKAIEYNHRSLKLAREIEDLIGTFNALSVLIEYYRYIGNYQQSLYCIQQSLPLFDSPSLNPTQIWRHCSIIAWAYNSAGFYDAATDYQKEVLLYAEARQESSMICVSYVHLGLICGRKGDYSEALANAQLAYQRAGEIPNKDISNQMMAYVSLQMGHIYRQGGDLENALSRYDDSIELYKASEFSTHLYQAHKGRLYCYISEGKDHLVKEELQTTLNLIDKNRSTILEEDNRNNFFDIEQSVYDLAMDYLYSKMNDAEGAFALSEDSRARSLLDSMNSEVKTFEEDGSTKISVEAISHSLALTDIQQHLPEHAQILQYAVLGDKVIMWVVTRTGIQTVKQDIIEEELNRKIGNFVGSISAPSDGKDQDIDVAARDLYDILLKPVEPFLDRGKQLCIVPDKALNTLPFDALVSTSSGNYLIEDYCLGCAPSSTVFLLCCERAAGKDAAKTERLLAVGNPRFDRNTFPALLDISSARREAEGIAKFYDSKSVLTEPAARKRPVISEMEKADIIHFALHCIINEEAPMHSKLVLAKASNADSDENEADGVLQYYEIYKIKLPQTRMVVLSACQTAVNRYYGGEGMLSIARPFLVSGVPLVVASLWRVDSVSTAELMIRFHEHRKRDNLSSAEALRRAQLDMLKGSEESYRRPYYWAAFIALGGWTSY